MHHAEYVSSRGGDYAREPVQRAGHVVDHSLHGSRPPAFGKPPFYYPVQERKVNIAAAYHKHNALAAEHRGFIKQKREADRAPTLDHYLSPLHK